MENMEKKESVPSDVIVLRKEYPRELRIREGGRVHSTELCDDADRYGLPMYCYVGQKSGKSVRKKKQLERDDDGYYTIPEMAVGEYLLVPYAEASAGSFVHCRRKYELIWKEEQDGVRWYDFRDGGIERLKGARKAEVKEIRPVIPGVRLSLIPSMWFCSVVGCAVKSIYLQRGNKEYFVEPSSGFYDIRDFQPGDLIYLFDYESVKRRYEVLRCNECCFAMVYWP